MRGLDLDNCRRILVVSPHLDDGVLSVGGIIEKAVANGADVVVATAFTDDAPPGRPYRRWRWNCTPSGTLGRPHTRIAAPRTWRR